MKSVVMVAYSFPPEGNAGAYRPFRFVQRLPQLGWHVNVISLDTKNYERYDPELLDRLPNDVEVVRVPERDLWQTIQRWRQQHVRNKLGSISADGARRIRAAHSAPLRSRVREIVRTVESSWYHPDMAMGWIRPAANAIAKICACKRRDVIWATGGPWSSFVVARRAALRTGVPYVLDFRDSWTMAETDFESRRPAWAIRRDYRTLYTLLKEARAVIFRYDTEAECYWRAYPGALETSRIHIIPNGYDGAIDDFAPIDGDKCTILYTGTVSPYRYDTLLQALRQFKKSDPTRAAQVRFLFVGESTEFLGEEAAKFGLSDIVETAGPVSNSRVIELQQQAHALLLIGVKPFKGYELCGSKVFGYLRAGRPILGVLPSDEVKKVLHKVGVSTVADIDSPCQIVAALRTLHDAWSEGDLASLVPVRSRCEAYSAERQTVALVRALEGEPAAEPFAPGSVDIPPSLQGEGNRIRMNGDSAA